MTVTHKTWRKALHDARAFWLPAVVIAILYAAAEACGLRRYASILTNTFPGPSPDVAAGLGSLYLILYASFTLLAPVLAIAAAITTVIERRTATER